MKVHRRDVGEEEARPSGRGATLVPILCCSGKRGGNRSSREEESGIGELFNASGGALGRLHAGRCHQAAYTVRSDCWRPEGRDLWCRSSSTAFHASLEVRDILKSYCCSRFLLVRMPNTKRTYQRGGGPPGSVSGPCL